MQVNSAFQLSGEPSATVQTVQRGGVAAVSIERLLTWAYGQQMVDRVEGWGSDPAERWLWGSTVSADGVMACARNAVLGARIPGTRWLGGGADVHPDALAVHAAVLTLARKPRDMVIAHARLGTRPGLPRGQVIAVRPAFMREIVPGVEEPGVIYNAKAGIGNRPWMCPVRIVDRGEHLSQGRALWRCWHGALATLAGHFRSAPHELRQWRVDDALPPSAPWELDTGENP